MSKETMCESQIDKSVLEEQLNEVELLMSMFPGKDEFCLDSSSMLDEIRRYISGEREAKPAQLSFTLTLQVEVEDNTIPLKLWCRLPASYPQCSYPEFHVSSSHLSRQQQRAVNVRLGEFVAEQEKGEACVTSVVMWLPGGATQYFLDSREEQSASTTAPLSSINHSPTTLSRLWIYSHHIYRKELLKKIPDSAKELDLTGFVLPGKPGIICVEGLKDNCDQYWQTLKYPNWKHISCKHREDIDLDCGQDLQSQEDEFRLFRTFEELAFEAHGDYGLRNDYHMDLGQFRKYLEEHNCQHLFHVFFGLEGKK